MATLEDIALLTKKSISDMTDEELMEHLREIRTSRNTVKPKQYEKEPDQTKCQKKKSRRITAEQKLLEAMLAELSPEEITELMQEVSGNG